MKNLMRFAALASFSAVALAASVPFTFTAGSPALASELNANFRVLARAVTVLEAKVAALEGTVPLTAASVAGTYRLLSLSSKAISDPAGLMVGAGTSSGNGTIVLGEDMNFTYSNVERMSGFSARLGNLSCAQANENTSSFSGHNHVYLKTNCTNTVNAFVSTEGPARSTSTGSGTWQLGVGNTILINPLDGPALTVYLAHGGRTGFSVEADNQSSQGTGQRLQIDVFVKQ